MSLVPDNVPGTSETSTQLFWANDQNNPIKNYCSRNIPSLPRQGVGNLLVLEILPRNLMDSLLTGEPGIHFFPNSHCDHQAQITTGVTRCGLQCCIISDDYVYKWLSLTGKKCACLMDKECCVTEDKAEASSCPVLPQQRFLFSSVQLLSRVWLFVTPMNCSMPGLPVHHQLPESTQTHVHWVSDAIQPSHPLLSPSPPALNLSQHQSLFKWVSSSHQVAKVLEFQLQHQSFQWTPRTDLL